MRIPIGTIGASPLVGSLGQESNRSGSRDLLLASLVIRNDSPGALRGDLVVLLASFLSEEVPFPRWHLFF